MQGADWPQTARRLVGLQQVGVDLGVFLPQMGRMTAGVHQAVTANAARIKAEGTDRWADLLRTTMPEGLVRDAILASPAWPDIAAAAKTPASASTAAPAPAASRNGHRVNGTGRLVQRPQGRRSFGHETRSADVRRRRTASRPGRERGRDRPA